MQTSLPQGFIPVMLTPFLENGNIDFDGLTKLTEFYLEAGAAGLFANCLSSEMYELSEDERLAITKHVVDAANGRVPYVGFATDCSLAATQIQVRNLARAADYLESRSIALHRRPIAPVELGNLSIRLNDPRSQ